jgi:hypothetical protein
VAVPLDPSSSAEAVATKSFGAAVAHFCRVMALSSGELYSTDSATVRTLTTARATVNSLTMS